MHIRTIDRVMQAVKSEMGLLGEEERRTWELDENGPWRVLGGVMDRSRMVLADSRKVAGGIVGSPFPFTVFCFYFSFL